MPCQAPNFLGQVNGGWESDFNRRLANCESEGSLIRTRSPQIEIMTEICIMPETDKIWFLRNLLRDDVKRLSWIS